MPRTKGSADHSALQAFETMRLLLMPDGVAFVPELTGEWRGIMEEQPGRCASTPRQAARAVIAAGLHRNRAGGGKAALDDAASALAARYEGWIADPVEQERQRVMVLHRWARNGLDPRSFEGWRLGRVGTAPPPDPWMVFCPSNVPDPLREAMGKMLFHVAKTAPFSEFFEAWCGVGALAHLSASRNERGEERGHNSRSDLAREM